MPPEIDPAALADLARRLVDLAGAVDYPLTPQWLTEFDALDGFEAAYPQSVQTNNEKFPSHG